MRFELRFYLSILLSSLSSQGSLLLSLPLLSVPSSSVFFSYIVSPVIYMGFELKGFIALFSLARLILSSSSTAIVIYFLSVPPIIIYFLSGVQPHRHDSFHQFRSNFFQSVF